MSLLETIAVCVSLFLLLWMAYDANHRLGLLKKEIAELKCEVNAYVERHPPAAQR
jgi:hypothetical protein